MQTESRAGPSRGSERRHHRDESCVSCAPTMDLGGLLWRGVGSGGVGAGLEAEELAGLAVEGVADGGEGAEADGAGVTVLEDREVGDGDADPRGELDQGDASVCEELVEVHVDAVVVDRFGH